MVNVKATEKYVKEYVAKPPFLDLSDPYNKVAFAQIGIAYLLTFVGVPTAYLGMWFFGSAVNILLFTYFLERDKGGEI